MTATVAVIGFLKFPAERMAELRPHLQAVVQATREHDGCVAYDVGEDPFEPGVVRFSELWPDHESLARHGAAPHIQAWRAVVRGSGVLERHFTVYDVTGARSL